MEAADQPKKPVKPRGEDILWTEGGMEGGREGEGEWSVGGKRESVCGDRESERRERVEGESERARERQSDRERERERERERDKSD